ncbi:hypothetical protein BKA57DRAFT_535268 [Linnemannia elongata]|nr:hypothetical protein BKA57DRAFT_535268 [Linnemannia elongata]
MKPVMSHKSHNNIFSGTPRLIGGEDDLYLSDPDTTIVSYEPPTPAVLPPTTQDHRDAVQVQVDAAQALTCALVTAAVMIAVAALVIVAAL